MGKKHKKQDKYVLFVEWVGSENSFLDVFSGGLGAVFNFLAPSSAILKRLASLPPSSFNFSLELIPRSKFAPPIFWGQICENLKNVEVELRDNYDTVKNFSQKNFTVMMFSNSFAKNLGGIVVASGQTLLDKISKFFLFVLARRASLIGLDTLSVSRTKLTLFYIFFTRKNVALCFLSGGRLGGGKQK